MPSEEQPAEQQEINFDDVANDNVAAFEALAPAPIEGEQEALPLETQPSLQEPASEPAASPEAPAPETDPRDVRIAELEARDAATQRQIDALIAGVAREPAPSVSPEPTLEPLGPAPDPVADQEGFVAWVQEDTRRKLDEQRQEFQELRQNDSNQQVQDQLWEEFSGMHEEWAEAPDLVRTAAEQAAGALGGSYSKEQLFYATHAQMQTLRDRMFGKSQQEEPRQAPDRTAGMDGGSRAAPVTPAAKDQKPPADLVDQMLGIQAEMHL